MRTELQILQNKKGGLSIWRLPVFLLLVGVLVSCASYYHKHYDFNQEFEKGDLQQALKTLSDNDKEAKGKNRFIYDVNNGLLLSILGKYEESNESFEKAFLFGEDYRVNYLDEAASYFTNPMFTVYRGEDHEHLMLLYFKAINYLKLKQPENALVECRRLNIRLNQLSDKYRSDEKFQRDAFVHTLMGIIYQSTKDYNNAFIAYRNALNVYESDYASLFGIQAPDQLRIDLLNTAYWSGLTDEFDQFREKFSMHDYQPDIPSAELVFFWHNGLAPVKDEWSINFVISRQPDNVIVFSNPTLGISFPFRVDDDNDRSKLANLEVFRVAFPRYVERPMYFQSAGLRVNDQVYTMQLTEDISKVAFLSLKQRFMTELGKGLLRAALKKASEYSIRKEDDRLGAVIGLVNAMTEKADTRNWQTLPHSIYYTRVPLNEGPNEATFQLQVDGAQSVDYQFTYTAQKGETLFHTFSSLESLR